MTTEPLPLGDPNPLDWANASSLEIATGLVERLGFRVVPVRGKAPIEPNWPSKGRRTPEAVAAMFGNGVTNYGIVTGAGIVALDLDGAEGQSALQEWLNARGHSFPRTIIVRTGGGGLHLYFKGGDYPNRTRLLNKVDFRGVGGHVVGPGSVHDNGRVYRFEPGHSPADVALAAPPAWLEELLQAPRQLPQPGKSPAWLTPDEVIPSGERNDRLAQFAGVLVRAGVRETELRVCLLAVAEAHCEDPASIRKDIPKIARSIAGRGSAQPPPSHHEIERLLRDDLRVSNTAVEAAVSSLKRLPQPPPLGLICGPADQVAIRDVDWIIADLLAKGCLTMVSGEQAVGKNLLVYNLVRAITRGERWAGLEGIKTPQNVILLEAEEDLSTTAVPRLKAVGADLQRVYPIQGLQSPDGTERFVQLQRDMVAIRAKAAEIGNVGMIIISPITSYIGDADGNSQEVVRSEVLGPLKQLAEELQCGIVLIKHMNKVHSHLDARDRIAGSAAWSEAMRLIIFIGANPKDEETDRRRAVFMTKQSIRCSADPFQPVTFRIRTAAVDGLRRPVPYAEITGEDPGFTIEDTLKAVNGKLVENGRMKQGKVERASDWILAQLEEEPKPKTTLDAAARACTKSKLATFTFASYESAYKRLKKTGEIEIGKRPETAQEWWVWCTDGEEPDWLSQPAEPPATAEGVDQGVPGSMRGEELNASEREPPTQSENTTPLQEADEGGE